MRTPPRHATGRPAESGFGMVEAIVAATIVLLIGAAISTSFISTMRTQNKAAGSERKIGAAEGLFERLKADSTWAGPQGANCSTMPAGQTRWGCDASWLQNRYRNDPVLVQNTATQTIRYEADLRVFGVDDNLDGTGNGDADGQRPDYYEATVRVRRAGSTDRWSTLTGNIEPPGRVSAGAISINICTVKRQWDERIPIASCEDRRPKEILLGYPAGGALAARGGAAGTHAAADWTAALDRAPSSAGPRGWAMVTYHIEPARNTTIELARTDGRSVRAPGFTPPPGCSSPTPSVVRCVTSPTRPIMRVASLTPGRYQARITRFPYGYVPWPLHSIPSGDTAIVEAGRTSRVLQVLRPVDRGKSPDSVARYSTPKYAVNLWNCDNSEVEYWATGPCRAGTTGGFSGYLAPAASARARWSFDSSSSPTSSGVESVGPRVPFIEFDNMPPGLYSGRVVKASQKSKRLRAGPGPRGGGAVPFIWIDPIRDGLGGDEPASRQTNYTQEWCNYHRRVAFLARYGLGPDGGIYNHSHPIYQRTTDASGRTIWVIVGYQTHQHHLYGATQRCPLSSGGGPGAPPPGPGSGGA